jgi:glycosyltransferase involved in cell wall biosynthesis
MAGPEVIVIAPVDKYIHYLNEIYFTRHVPILNLQPQKISVFKDILFFKELYAIYKTEKPELVLHFTIKPTIYGSIAASALSLKSISTLTGLGFSYTQWKYRFLFKWFFRYALSRNDRIAFHNRDDLNLLVNNDWVDKNKSVVISGSGVDTNKFRKQQVQKSTGQFIFLFSGRIIKDKGITEFVKAAIQTKSIIKNVEFWVIGDYNPHSPNSIAKSDLLEWINLRMIKYFGHESDVRKYINKADVVVLPSYREGLPRAILEAMSMERPIIATDVAGCRDLVKHGWNGFLVPAKQIHPLAEAMVALYNLSEERREQMGKNSRQLVLEKFDLNIVLHAYDELIEELFEKENMYKQNYSDLL